MTAALDFVEHLELERAENAHRRPHSREIKSRLGFLQSVGLQYLTLSRSAATLSGGESQRIRLATQIGSSLMGVLYILDEPSIGLHQRDNDMLLATLKRLRDLGNTLLVVEHDEDTMRAADYIVDIGPGAGVHGRRGGLRRNRGRGYDPQRLPHRRVPFRAEDRSLSPPSGATGNGHFLDGGGRHPEQPAKRWTSQSPWDCLPGGHRRVRLGQILPGQRDDLQDLAGGA